MSRPSIAILGWGSLIWDPRSDFDSQIGCWTNTGPLLPIEFCRISQSRKDALTLVIDRKLGTTVETFYAFSRRTNPMDAVCDLRSREGTTFGNIGFIDLTADKSPQSRDPEVARIIKDWATERSIKFVVWTDLESNFQEKKCTVFSFERALDHLRGLSSEGIREAVKYIVRTHKQINTDFRQRIATVEWFKEQVTLFEKNA